MEQSHHAESHQLVECTICGASVMSSKKLRIHIRKYHTEDPGGGGGKKEYKPKPPPKAWNESFPVDKESFYQMKAGEIESTCPKCKKPFSKFRHIYCHWKKIKCKKDHHLSHVSASPDMAIVIKNEGEKLR